MDKFPAGGEVLGRMRRSQLQRLSKYYLMSIVSHQNRFVNIEFLVVSLCEKSFYTAVIESLQYMCTKGEKNPLKKSNCLSDAVTACRQVGCKSSRRVLLCPATREIISHNLHRFRTGCLELRSHKSKVSVCGSDY